MSGTEKSDPPPLRLELERVVRDLGGWLLQQTLPSNERRKILRWIAALEGDRDVELSGGNLLTFRSVSRRTESSNLVLHARGCTRIARLLERAGTELPDEVWDQVLWAERLVSRAEATLRLGGTLL